MNVQRIDFLRQISTVVASFIKAVLVLGISVFPFSLHPQTQHLNIEALDTFITTHMKRTGLPGTGVSIATKDSVIFAKGYGREDRSGNAITSKTPFFLGSVTKTFTAAAIAKLSDQGKVDLDAPVEDYISDFSLQAPFEEKSITVRHLLHHRSGLKQWDGHDERAQKEGIFNHIKPGGKPGERAEYSSLNFIILGRIIEVASGKSYKTYVEQELLDPLGMKDSFVDTRESRPPDLAKGHQNIYGINWRKTEPLHHKYLLPAGFIVSSAADMGRYCSMLLNNGTFDHAQILKNSTAGQLFLPMNGLEVGPGMAWGRSTRKGELVLGHSGNATTSSARVRLVPGTDYGIVMLVNTNSGPFFDASADLLEGIHRIVEGDKNVSYWPKERIFKGLLLVGTVLSIVSAVKTSRKWHKEGYPVGLNGSPKTIGRLAFDVGGAAFLFFGLPRLVGVPLGTQMEYFPDLGMSITISASAGLISGVLRSFVHSK